MTLTDIFRSATLSVVLSCGPTLATRSYSNPATARANAYLDMKAILEEMCPDVHVSNNGFACTQYTTDGPVTSNYQWEEIQDVQIIGSIESTTIYAHGPIWEDKFPQCYQLAAAMRAYLGK